MKLRFTFLLFLCVVVKSSWSQLIYHQDSFHGGITAGGFSTGMGIGNGIIQLYIEENSTIRKAYLIVYSVGENLIGSVLINNQSFTFDNSNIVSVFGIIAPSFTPIKVHVLDVTEFLGMNPNSSIIIETLLHPDMPFKGVFAPYVYIEYENPNLPIVNSCIIINELFGNGLAQNNIQNLNPIDTDFPVGFSIYTDRHSYLENERTYVSFNDNYLGLVYGSDNTNQPWMGGVKGHFYYQNNALYGLDDDIANLQMDSTDALADVSSFISNLSTSVDFTLQHINYPNVTPVSSINLYLAYFLTYTSPCQPFAHSLLTSDTTTCANSPVQLGATGGVLIGSTPAYEWLPQTNLSCYDCPNPVFLGDSTMNYTVRIWSTDSCSVVKPMRVRVVPQPNFESIDVTESICGFSTGIIAGTSTGLSVPHTYQLNDEVPQNNFSFSNLSAGEYTLTVTDANGCSRDSTVQVLEINNIQATFAVNPSSGAAPLQVQTQNNSQNATQYEWFWEAQSSSAFSPSILLDTAGVYTLTLVASNGAAHCNDTAAALIFVEEPFVVFAYTFVTDEADIYQIFLSGVSEYRYDLYAFDGKLVYRQSGNVAVAGYVDLWEISRVASGMYVFRVRVKDNAGNEQEVEGKVVVVR